MERPDYILGQSGKRVENPKKTQIAQNGDLNN